MCFIDIVEKKYKIMSLGGHNQEKEKQTTPMDWIGASTLAELNSTKHNSGRLDWDINTATQIYSTMLLKDGNKACSTTAPTHTPHFCTRRKPRRDQTSIENERKRTPPHQKGHRHAEPFAAMPLQ